MEPRERSPFSSAVNATVRAERAAKGWTQDELVRASGLSKGVIRRIEADERVADSTQLDRLAKAFGLSVAALIARAEERLAAQEV